MIWYVYIGYISYLKYHYVLIVIIQQFIPQVDVCTLAAPGQKECSAALLRMSAARPLLTAPSQPLNELGYFACLDAVITHSRLLSEGMAGLAGAVKQGQPASLARAVTGLASAVCGLAESAAQAAYLVAASDPTSTTARPGLADQTALARAASAIDAACRELCAPQATEPRVLAAATAVARHTSALCHACREASARAAAPQAKRHFVQAAKDVASCTSVLVRAIKALDHSDTGPGGEEARAKLIEATGPLREAVRGVREFADSPEFAAVPARLSQQARDSQEAVLYCGRYDCHYHLTLIRFMTYFLYLFMDKENNIINCFFFHSNIITESCSMVEAAQVLALNSADRSQWQALAQHSKAVSDTIKSLVTNIRYERYSKS